MSKLEADGLSRGKPAALPVEGAPTQVWRLTSAGHARFADTHAEMTVQMISAVIKVFGQKGMDQRISVREDTMRANYREGCGAPEASRPGLSDGGCLITENHCPICGSCRPRSPDAISPG